MTVVAATKKQGLDLNRYLGCGAEGITTLLYPKKHTIFAQGSVCDAVYLVRNGKVKLTVVSKNGKEATISILNGGELFGEDCLGGQRLRRMSAITMGECLLTRMVIAALSELLHREQAFSDFFMEQLLDRNIRYQQALVDQLFSSSEKRLARALLSLAYSGNEEISETVKIPGITQEALAEMVGTTRSRVNGFMTRFRKLGFIEYDGELTIHTALLDVFLRD